MTEEYNFECAAATINYKSAKTRYNNEVSVPVRSPLKLSAMRNIDSPVMLLRYKQIKGIQRKQLIRSAEMCHMARDDQN